MSRNAPDRGFSLIEAMVVVAILSIAILSIAALNYQLRRQLAGATSVVQIDVFRRNIIALVSDENAWQVTVNQGRQTGNSPNGRPNGMMDCLYFSSSCAGIAKQTFALYDGAGNLIYDGTDQTQGITENGVACKGYSSAGNPACPFQFILKWTPICADALCNPATMVNVSADLVTSGTTTSAAINLSRYSIPAIYRGTK